MSKKLTPWFPRWTYPARKGYYISTVHEGSDWYRYWDGKSWYYGGETLELAVREYTYHREAWPRSTPVTWRGLAKKP